MRRSVKVEGLRNFLAMSPMRVLPLPGACELCGREGPEHKQCRERLADSLNRFRAQVDGK